MKNPNDKIVYVDGLNIKSFGGLNHLINIMEKAPNKINNNKVIYKVWIKKSFKNHLKNNRNIIVKSNFFGNLPTPFNLIWNFFVFRLVCLKNKPDYILSLGGLLLFKYKNSTGVYQNVQPFIDKGSSLNYQNLRVKMLRYLWKISSKNYKKHIFHSKDSANLIRSYFNTDKEYKIIYHGINNFFRIEKNKMLDKLSNLSKKVELNHEISFTYVTSAYSYKNNKKIIKSFENIYLKGFRFHLNLIVANGPELGEIKNIIDTCDFKSQITFLTDISQDEIKHILHEKTDVAIFASNFESFGIILVEKMASGLPIFALKKSCIPEILGPNGNYFNIDKSESFYENIISLLINSEDIRKKTLLTWERSDIFNWDKAAYETWNFIFK